MSGELIVQGEVVRQGSDIPALRDQLPATASGFVVRCTVHINGRDEWRQWPVTIAEGIARADINAGGRDPCLIQNIELVSVLEAIDFEIVPLKAIEIRIDGALVLRRSTERNQGRYAQRRPAITEDRHRLDWMR